MDKSFNFQLSKNNALSKLVLNLGMTSFIDLYNHVHQLPYGRNSNRYDLELVIKEEMGTYSSKHAFLKQVAIENNFDKLSLWIGIYKMNAKNTTGINSVLEAYNLDYIPEAHCYLKYNNKRYDITFSESTSLKFEDSLLIEEEITPEQIGIYKVKIHQDYLKKWIEASNLSYSFEDLWQIRENCILALQNKKA
ncbi:hypothetical protein [Winogradskyella haliclonae]|uniref:Uncharacterized protein n=1 Tax=Winogradskyella haliclonae TaxID=2048558 RepID=A0ABQ2BZZ0_9FLAO|nr:hypothetical protein [Winogradskyella haliclonae]GGI57373.1 hypothetical protein GCM10011444_16820 [Winogradskyella haliclonae]